MSISSSKDKLRYSPTIEHHSAIKKNKLLVYATTWMNIKGIILCEKNPILKDYILYDSLYVPFVKGKIIGLEDRSLDTAINGRRL